ncbi:MAG: lytic murein transglycosylase [Gemmobacter sp.]|nr:lytic murein transglycosylase [Gemmobacter sp.]
MRNMARVLAVGLVFLPVGCGATGPETSPRPAARASEPVAVTRPSTPNPGFDRWVSGFRGRALAKGISQGTFDRAFANAFYDPDVIRRDKSQAEFTKTIWDYLDSATSDTRVSNGRDALARNRSALQRIEARYGVPAEVVVAVWGMESNYGNFRGKMGVIPSLATLAYDGRRGAFFEEQLVAALKILQAGDIAPERMTGSWAGAMGHTQFIPTSYLGYAVDFTGDGRRDIWSDDPTDALASTANYLAKSGWTAGQPWGLEVILPSGFNFGQAGKKTKKSVADWRAQGVRAATGSLPNAGQASILLPAGSNGIAFMIFDNFRAISRYNNADSYVIGVGHLSDRIAGKGPFVGKWPRDDKALTFADREELQRRLTAAGFDTGGVDGNIGPATITAIQGFQQSVGLTADGFATPDLLKRLR